MINIYKPSKRALRRHHYQRLKIRRIKNNYWSKALDSRLLSLSINTPCPCSCYMCGNPRKYFNSKTLQEKKVDLIENFVD